MLDDMYSAIYTSDNGILLAGNSNSNASGDKSEDNHGPIWSFDNWIVKLTCDYTLSFRDTTTCIGEPVNIDATSFLGCAYEWSDGVTTAIRTVTPSEETTYKVTVTSVNGCTVSDSITVSTQTQPIVSLGNDTIICVGSSVILDAENAGANFSWLPAASSQTLTVTATGLYEVTVTNSNGCSTTDAINVLVNPLPVVDLGSDQTICSDDTYTLDAGNPGLDYLWSTGETTQTIIVDTTATYSVTVSDSDGCSSEDNFILTVNPIPTVTLLNDTTICDGESTSLTFNLEGTGPYDIIYDDGSSSNMLNGINDGHTITVSPSTTTTYSIVSIDDDATPTCTNTGNNVVVTVNPVFSFSQNATICQGDSLEVNGVFVKTSGTYTDSLSSFYGCDSLLVIDLFVAPLPVTMIPLASCNPIDTGTVVSVFPSFYSCDSTVITTTSLLPSDTLFTQLESCNPVDTGLVVFQLSNQFGCDSVIFQTTSLLPSDTLFTE